MTQDRQNCKGERQRTYAFSAAGASEGARLVKRADAAGSDVASSRSSSIQCSRLTMSSSCSRTATGPVLPAAVFARVDALTADVFVTTKRCESSTTRSPSTALAHNLLAFWNASSRSLLRAVSSTGGPALRRAGPAACTGGCRYSIARSIVGLGSNRLHCAKTGSGMRSATSSGSKSGRRTAGFSDILQLY